MAIVYWIHLPEHTDIFKEGYVGITGRTLERRWIQHKSWAKQGGKYALSAAIRKYGEKIIVETVLISSIEYCQEIENKLRTNPNTGWNISVGGEFASMTGRKHSEETRKLISERVKASDRILNIDGLKERQQKAKQTPPWCHQSANTNVWIIADEIFNYLQNNPKHGCCKLAKYFGFDTYSTFNIHKRITKQNWNPLLDNYWLEWSKNTEKEIFR